jgi:hypothetical protein
MMNWEGRGDSYNLFIIRYYPSISLANSNKTMKNLRENNIITEI